MKHILLFLIICCIGCFSGPPDISQTGDYRHIKVIKVIDGDTIKLANGELLRYIGIDTPESQIKKNGIFTDAPQPFSQQAFKLNKQLVENKYIRLEFDAQKRDKYNRLLAYCFTDTTFVNEKLLQEGLATLYTFPPNIKYVERFIAAQRLARAQQKGIWASRTINHRKAKNFINQICTVRGTVINTYESKNVILLNFDRDYKTDFTVVIYKKSKPYFTKQNIDPARYYKGKTIEVTGRIREYNGPEIIVSIPEEIKIVSSD